MHVSGRQKVSADVAWPADFGSLQRKASKFFLLVTELNLLTYPQTNANDSEEVKWHRNIIAPI